MSIAFPPLGVPASSSTVKVSIINTTARIDQLPSQYHFEHSYEGFDWLNCPCLAFLIEHPPTGRKLLFDLGMRKDWENLTPSIVQMIKAVGAKLTVQRSVAEILEAGGVCVKDIEGIIWSHHHCDHTGDASLFPATTSLYVGPGFKEAFIPGYPANPEAFILESDYADRQVHEVSFHEASLVFNGFPAIDFFGDGSFYLLDAPGHSEAHISALARTTAASEGHEPTFMFLGADCCHHGGEFRPSEYLPLPENFNISPKSLNGFEGFCSGTLFASIHRLTPSPAANVEPFLVCKPEITHDLEQTKSTIEQLKVFDASENVFTVMAHDQSLMDIVSFFPKTANEWRAQGWRERGLWRWLEDFKVGLQRIEGIQEVQTSSSKP